MERQVQKEGMVRAGAELVLAYTLSLSDGTLVDEATKAEPLIFTAGDGTLDQSLESLLVGLAVGERYHFLIAAEEGFGLPDPEQVHPLSRSEFSEDAQLEPGTVYTFEAPSGEAIAATIDRVEDDQVWVDFNHPLAGRDLQFEVEILSIGRRENDEN